MNMRVGVVGSGYVGSVVAACLAHVGHEVTGIESDPAKLARLRAGSAPFHEPGLDPLIKSAMEKGRLSFSADLAEGLERCDVLFLCVGTPPGADGQPDMTALSEVARSIGQHLRRHHVIVTKSTVPIGTARWLGALIESSAAERSCFSIVSNPEFLREGNAVQDFLHPDRVVLGADDAEARRIVSEVYRPILDQQIPGDVGRRDPVPLILTTLAAGEMTKYASNAFLATKISFANEIARLCDLVGADITEVTAAMGLDSRIGGRFLDAGIGWGGSCFGKDLAAIVSSAIDYGYHPRLLEATLAVNDAQRQLVIDRLLAELHTVRGARVCLLGLAFKPNTDDVRDSPGLDIACRLLHRGAFVSAYDPMVKSVPGEIDIRIESNPYEAARGADAVVLATEWPEFLTLDLVRIRTLMHGNLLLDGRNIFNPAAAFDAGLRYAGIGRPRGVATKQMPVGLG